MRVRVIKEGFMFGSMQKVGTEIELEKDEHFSKNWMVEIEDIESEEVEPEVPEKESVKPSSMKVDELRAALEQKGIPIPDDAKKADLVELLEAA